MALQSSGVDIDALTGQPVETLHRVTAARERDRRERAVETANRLRHALASPDGQLMRDTLTQHLADRIEHLMQQDERCQALLQVLGEWARTLSIGTRLAHALMAALEPRE